MDPDDSHMLAIFIALFLLVLVPLIIGLLVTSQLRQAGWFY